MRIEEKYGTSERKVYPASEIGRMLNIPPSVIVKTFKPEEWHHTQVYHSHRFDAQPTDFYLLPEIKAIAEKDNKSEYWDEELASRFAKNIEEYKRQQETAHDIVEEYAGFFGYSAPDGSNALWFKGTATLRKNGWWYLPNGQRKRKILTLTEAEYERKKNRYEAKKIRV
jgi:hypothetical protein